MNDASLSRGFPLSKSRVGMILFVLTEGLFFGLLILAYLYFARGSSEAQELDVRVTGVYSLLLLSSSFSLWRAERSWRRGRMRRRSLWLGLTILLGAAFLVGQGLEWKLLIQRGRTISRDLFGTTFFTLTGFHGLHVLVGLSMLSVLLGLGWRRDFDRTLAEEAVTVLSWYWHFVDAVWLVIFSVVYLGVPYR